MRELLLFFVLLCAVVSCSEVTSTSCVLNSDCQAPATCSAGVCRVDCVEDRDCLAPLSCQEGVCAMGPDALTCGADSDCPVGSECLQGTCETVEGFCQQNGDCPSGSACSRETNRCFEDEGGRPCQDVSDCFADEVCVDGLCQRQSEPQGCVSDADCPEAFICVDAACAQGCAGDGECPQGQVCQQGRCQSCTSDEDCAEGLSCREGVCGSECLGDDDCGEGQRCSEGACGPECLGDDDCGEGQRCSAGACGPECLGDDDCGEGQRCSAGTCGPECVSESDCAPGQVCQEGACVEAADSFSGDFLISSPSPIQRCNDFLSINFDPRVAEADHSGRAFSLTFFDPETIYNGVIDGGRFTVSWSGFNGATQNCGDLNTSNTYAASFEGEDTFEGTLTVDFFFQIGSCDCQIRWPVVGTRQ